MTVDYPYNNNNNVLAKGIKKFMGVVVISEDNDVHMNFCIL